MKNCKTCNEFMCGQSHTYNISKGCDKGMELKLEKYEMAEVLSNLKDNLGKSKYSELWHYAEYLDIIIDYLYGLDNN